MGGVIGVNGLGRVCEYQVDEPASAVCGVCPVLSCLILQTVTTGMATDTRENIVRMCK